MPVDRNAIDAQLRDIGEGERWWEQREFRALPHILHAGEQIHGLVNGKLSGSRRPRLLPAGRWLIVVTSHRLICLRQERVGRKQVEIPAGQITAMHQRSRLRDFQITLDTPLQRYRLRIAKGDAFRFAGVLTRLMPEPPAPRPQGELPAAPGVPALLPAETQPRGLVARLSRRSIPDPALRAHLARLETTVDRLQDDVERLQQQVSFLEDLLQKQSDETFLARSGNG